jgi:cytochrome c biogenesis protein
MVKKCKEHFLHLKKGAYQLTVKTSRPWSFFSSIKLTIVVLVLIAGLSILGTFFPQQEGAQVVARHFSPGVAKFLVSLQLFDIYHSLLFYILIALLSLNLIVCSANRFGFSWRQYKTGLYPPPQNLFDNITPEHSLKINRQKEETLIAVSSLLKEKFGKIAKNETAGAVFLAAERGKFSIFGVYIVHVSILIIIAGVIIGSLSGFSGNMNIRQGQAVNVVTLRDGKGNRQLDFSVRCNKFTVEFYEDGTPKIYLSDLSFIKDGHVIQNAPLKVNHPVTIDKIRFYQSSYGVLPQGRAFLTHSKGGEKSPEIMLTAGSSFELPGTKAKVEVLRVEENIMQMGPAVKLRITSPDSEVQFWVFQQIDQIVAMKPDILSNVPLFNPGLFKPYVFTLHRIENEYYTGLQVVEDSGEPFVAVGGLLMIGGLLIVFFLLHRRIWLRLDAFQGQTRISIAGRSSRNPAKLKREIDLLRGLIKEKVET